MDAMTELAKLLKERDNPHTQSITIGTVLAPPPEIKIKLNDSIVLTKSQLVFSSHMLSNYNRTAKINGGEPSTIEFIDTIKSGDQVIIVPTVDGQTYYVVDKAVNL
jgi:hypothetical protein